MSINEEKLIIWRNQVDKRLDRLEGKNHKSDEPLIKDEKIRKAVRAWAEANNDDGETRLKYYRDDNHLSTSTNCIEFNCFTPLRKLEDGATYTIAELCGEEE